MASKYPNGMIIYKYMKLKKIRGDVRDYVLILANRIIDYRDSYGVTIKGDENTKDVFFTHKKNLKKLIGEEEALNFWHPKFGRLVTIKEGTKKKNK